MPKNKNNKIKELKMDPEITNIMRLYNYTYNHIVDFLNGKGLTKDEIDKYFPNEDNIIKITLASNFKDHRVLVYIDKDQGLITFIYNNKSEVTHLSINKYEEINNIADCIALHYAYHIIYGGNVILKNDIYESINHSVYFGDAMIDKKIYKISIFEEKFEYNN